MMDKIQNKYRIPSARWQQWNYCWVGMYFITICTANHLHYFGKNRNGKMELSEIGKIVESEWLKTFGLRADMNFWMGEFVVMPNHFHAIVGVGENEFNTPWETEPDAQCRDAMHCVSTATQKSGINHSRIQIIGYHPGTANPSRFSMANPFSRPNHSG